jgi:hypothetical protein
VRPAGSLVKLSSCPWLWRAPSTISEVFYWHPASLSRCLPLPALAGGDCNGLNGMDGPCENVEPCTVQQIRMARPAATRPVARTAARVFCARAKAKQGAASTNVHGHGCQWARRVTREGGPVRGREGIARERERERVQHACRIAGFACGH